MTHAWVMDDFAEAFAAPDTYVAVQEDLRTSRAEDMCWISVILTISTTVAGLIVTVTGLGVDNLQDILAGNLQDGNLLHHILFKIAKPQGKRKDFVKVQLKTTKNEVQEKDALIDKYTAIVSNHSSLGKIKRKQETWVLLAKLHYIQQTRLLRQVDPDAAEKTAAAEDIGDEEGDVAPVPPAYPHGRWSPIPHHC